MKVIISGGGTGGHVFPAIAIADAFKAWDKKTDILFVGAKGKLEMTKVPQAGYEIKGLWISGLQRKFTFKNVLIPIKILSSFFKCVQIIKAFKPDAVIGVGGYASGPVLRVAAWMKVPVFIQEQNSYAGMTNKILSKHAHKVFTAFPKMESFFKAEKIHMLGNPVRKEFENLIKKSQEAYNYLNLTQDKKTLCVLGGSLGARSLNEAMRSAYVMLQQQHDIQILWQVGNMYHAEFSVCDTATLPNVKLVSFIDRMDAVYAVADLVISRAGALTLAELAATSTPAILVPSPHVAEDHQTKNADAFVQAHAAVLIKNSDAKDTLISTALELISNTTRLQLMEKNIHQLHKPKAANEIVQAIIKEITLR